MTLLELARQLIAKGQQVGLFGPPSGPSRKTSPRLRPEKRVVQREGKAHLQTFYVAPPDTAPKTLPKPVGPLMELFQQLRQDADRPTQPEAKRAAPKPKEPREQPKGPLAEMFEAPEPAKPVAAKPQTPKPATKEHPPIPPSRPRFGFDLLNKPTASHREHANRQARELAARLSEEKRLPTPAERTVLAAFTGDGGLTGDLNAHYTPTALASSLWNILGRLGIGKGSAVLEPSMGAGVFLETAPTGVALTGVEYNSDTGAIARLLHPNADVHPGMSFEEYVTGPGIDAEFDAVIANPPYGLRGETTMVHRPEVGAAEEYFIDTSLDKLKDGGIGLFLINGGPLERAASTGFRERLMARADILATVQLPATAFKESNSAVPPAVLVVRKRDHVAGLALARLAAKRGAEVLKVAGVYDDQFHNGKSLDRADNILGTWDGESRTGQYGAYKDIKGTLDKDALTRLSATPLGEARALDTESLTAALKGTVETDELNGAIEWAKSASDTAPLGTISEDGTLILKIGPMGKPRWMRLADETTGDQTIAAMSLSRSLAQFAQLINRAPQTAEARREELAATLTEYLKRHGNPHDDETVRQLARTNHVLANLLAAVTKEGELAPHLTKALKAATDDLDAVDRNDPDALAALLLRRGELTTKRFAELWGKRPVTDAVEQLSKQYALDPSGKWRPSAEVFVGRVVEGVHGMNRAAELAGERGDTLSQQIFLAQAKRFTEILPRPDLTNVDISPRDPFVPTEVIEAFVKEVLTRGDNFTCTVKDGVYYLEQEHRTYLSSFERERIENFRQFLNHATAVASVRDKEDKTADQIQAERKANIEKAKAIEDDFKDSFRRWLLQSDYQEQVEEAYVAAINSYIPPPTDESPLGIEGWQGHPLHGFQNADVRHLMAVGGGIAAHDVGLGKTLLGVALAAKLKQEGRTKKPLVVVPKSLLPNWRKNVKRAMPNASMLVIGETLDEKSGKWRDSTAAEAMQQWVKAATGEWDYIVVTRDRFEELAINPTNVERLMRQDANVQRQEQLLTAEEDAFKGHGRRRKAKSIRERTAEITAAIQKQVARMFRDLKAPIYFEDLGVDALIIDEAHSLKNLYAAPAVFGQTPKFMGGGAESKRAQDALFKSRLIREQNNGQGVFLLTATPTKNSPLELYNMLSYVMPDMAEIGTPLVEGFVDRYCEIKPEFMAMPDGAIGTAPAVVGFKNLHELRHLMSRYLVRRTAETVGMKIPKRKDYEVVFDLPDRVMGAYKSLAESAYAAAKDPFAKGKDHLFSFFSKMRRLTLDPSLQYENFAGLPNPRYVKAAEIAKGALDRGGKTLMFLDMGRAAQDDDDPPEETAEQQTAYDRLVDQLVASGINRDEVAVVTASTVKSATQRNDIQNRFNAGELKVLIGSTGVIGEGFNLQKGTTDMVHLDVPWDPGTYWQRLGRSVRQGNVLDEVNNHVLLAGGSFDGFMYGTMLGKRGWMQTLWDSASDEGNNAVSGSYEEIIAALSSDPAEARAAIARSKAEMEEKAGTAKAVKGIRRLDAVPLKLERLAELDRQREELRYRDFRTEAARANAIERHRQKVLKAEVELAELREELRKDPNIPEMWRPLIDSDAPFLVTRQGQVYAPSSVFIAKWASGRKSLVHVDQVNQHMRRVRRKGFGTDDFYVDEGYKMASHHAPRLEAPHIEVLAEEGGDRWYTNLSIPDTERLEPVIAAAARRTAERGRNNGTWVETADGEIVPRADFSDDVKPLQPDDRILLNTRRDRAKFRSTYPRGVLGYAHALPFPTEDQGYYEDNVYTRRSYPTPDPDDPEGYAAKAAAPPRFVLFRGGRR